MLPLPLLTDLFKVLSDVHKAKQQQDSVKDMRKEALRVQDDLEKEVARHNQAQTELDNLYNSIFQGPTPGFPEEDDAERKVQAAQQACSAARSKLEAEQQAVNLLNQATTRLRAALNYIEDALDHSRMDMFGGSSLHDFLERDALHNAESQVNQVHMLVVQAQRYSAQVRDLPQARISQGNLMSDVFFDNIFSDMEFHDKIKTSRDEVRRTGSALQAQVQAAGARVADAEVETAQLAEQLRAARAALQRAREQIFERLANGVPPTPPKDHGPATPPKDGAPPTPRKDGPSSEVPPPYEAPPYQP